MPARAGSRLGRGTRGRTASAGRSRLLREENSNSSGACGRWQVKAMPTREEKRWVLAAIYQLEPLPIATDCPGATGDDRGGRRYDWTRRQRPDDPLAPVERASSQRREETLSRGRRTLCRPSVPSRRSVHSVRHDYPGACLLDYSPVPELARARLTWPTSGCGGANRIEELEFFVRQSKCARCYVVDEVIRVACPGDGQHMGAFLQDPCQANLRR